MNKHAASRAVTRIMAELGDMSSKPLAELPTKGGIYTINPDMAREWLRRNTGNRPVNINHVRHLAEQMSEDKWQLNGQTITFRKSGGLHDGQHRLMACIVAGVPFKSYVLFGIADESFVTLDTGKVRQGKDVLALAGYTHTAALAAAARVAMAYERGIIGVRGHKLWATNDEVLQWVNEHQDLTESVKLYYFKKRLRHYLTPSIVGFVHWRASKMNREKADEFFSHLASGAALDEGSPILKLRDRLIENTTAPQRAEAHVILALTIKAWNAFYLGRPVEILRLTRAESFPRFTEEKPRSATSYVEEAITEAA